jgi:hypothetical protein
MAQQNQVQILENKLFQKKNIRKWYLISCSPNLIILTEKKYKSLNWYLTLKTNFWWFYQLMIKWTQVQSQKYLAGSIFGGKYLHLIGCATLCAKTAIVHYLWGKLKEYIERRHGEPFKFLFLPKMGLLGSQAVLEKKVQFWIMSNFLPPFFQLFMDKINFFKFFFRLQRPH